MRWKAVILICVVAAAATVLACSSSGPTLDPNATPSAMLSLKAKDLHWDRRGLAVPADTEVTITLDNEDNGVKHNFALYRDKRASDKLFVGDLFDGKKSTDYSFKAPPAGTYFFRCDAHPDTMTGTFVAK